MVIPVEVQYSQLISIFIDIVEESVAEYTAEHTVRVNLIRN